MIGVIERIKNSVLLKCSTLNDEIIAKTLTNVIDESIYHFAEDLISLISDVNFGLTEEDLRVKTSDIIKLPIIKKIKRKLFIDSLALQITNDTFIERYVNKEITMDELKKTYINELNENKSSNQLNMTEDLNLNEIIEKLNVYVDKEITNGVRENVFLVNAINTLLDKTKDELEKSLEAMITEADNKYLDILTNELKQIVLKVVKDINKQYSIHDFRIVTGPTHTNLIFDVLIPSNDQIKHDLLKEQINEKLQNINPNYQTVMQIEHSFV